MGRADPGLEILGLLKTPMKSMFSMFEPGVVDRVKPEIDAVLRAMLFAFTTGIGRPTPGMKLENVRYAPIYLLDVVCCLLLAVSGSAIRLEAPRSISIVFPMDYPGRFTDFSRAGTSDMKKLETLVITCQFVNLLVFLRKGMYRSLPERCLGMKMESITPSTAPRSINFEYMTRQLLWEGLMEFGNFVLPFLTWSSSRTSAAFQGISSVADARSSQCSLCSISPPQTPYITSCKHVYCYYCLQTAVATEDELRVLLAE
ncbi:Zinc finger, RING-type, conserved site [Phytophthora cactorum]|nr:Zinc finger, RING-type, conserved site [Phytophthora cactorum]